MPKHLEQLGSLENFSFSSVLTAEEIDRDKLKKYVFGLLQDKARAQDARDEAREETVTVREELDEKKAELAKKGDPDLAKALEKSEAKVKELEGEVAKRDLDAVRKEVASEKGLTEKQAKYLEGKDKAELEKSADEFIEDNGIVIGDPDDQDDDEPNPLRTTPRSTVRNPGDPNPGASSPKEIDFEAEVAKIQSHPFL